MDTIVVSSGYPPPTLAAMNAAFHVIDIRRQDDALAYLRETTTLPLAVCVGYARLPSGAVDLTAGQMIDGIHQLDPELPVVISTAAGHPSIIVELVKHGAFGYVIEPPTPTRTPEVMAAYTQDLLHALTQAVRWRKLLLENRRLRQDLVRRGLPDQVQAISASMLDALTLARKVAPTSATVLITGASGTGKELVARTIHQQSDRPQQPFVAVNCAALPENLLASELFGHVRGAFTGADQDRPGLIREAGEGTLFLDEIGSVPPSFQVMLLRTLEQRTARAVGATTEYPVRCRFIAAGNRDLAAMVRQGRFREDFFYRLNSFHLHLPPLKERRSDLPVLVQHFLLRAAEQYRRGVNGVDPRAMAVLEQYDWPGNVRQLRNVIERAVIVCEGQRITLADIDPAIRQASAPEPGLLEGDYTAAMQRFEKRLLRQALSQAGGNLSAAARQLNMKRTTLSYRLKQLGLRAG